MALGVVNAGSNVGDQSNYPRIAIPLRASALATLQAAAQLLSNALQTNLMLTDLDGGATYSYTPAVSVGSGCGNAVAVVLATG